MRTYRDHLPLYEEPSESFRTFVKEFEKQKNYTIQFDRQFGRLKFVPTDLSANAVEGIIPLQALKHPNLKVISRDEVLFFATKFNLLSSIYAWYSGKQKRDLTLSLIQYKNLFPASKVVIVVTFATEDMDLSMIIDNLLKTIK